MKEVVLHKRLCLNFCSYYKPSKNKELACRGFSVVERLLQRGKKIIFQKSEKVFAQATANELAKNMCITCSFYEKDCDFMKYKVNSPPCGGFILLGQLLESGSITLDDIISNIN
jgi:hypothetical protein